MSEGGFKCVKISTIVLYSLSLVFYIIFLAISAIGLAAIIHTKPDEKTSQENLDQAKVIIIAVIIYLVLALLITILGLVGAVKEHTCTMTVLSVLSILKIIYQVWVSSWFSIFFEVVFLIFTGSYAYLLCKRSSLMRPSSGRAV